VLVALILDARNLAGLIASLGCLLIVALVLSMLTEIDRPRQDRGFEQAESVRGVFDDRRSVDRPSEHRK
jgi:hypothetical protein